MQKERIAIIYWEQSKADLRLAKKSIKINNVKAMLLAAESLLNLFTSICVAKGKYQNPSYNITEMLLVCSNFASKLAKLKPICLKIDEIQEKNLMKDVSDMETKIYYKMVKKIFKEVQKIIWFKRIKPFNSLKFFQISYLW